jgi:N-glycosylase/DNA lyase
VKKLLEQPDRVMMSDWQQWQPTATPLRISPLALAETLRGGQAFRWRMATNAPETWQGVWANCVARVRVGRGGRLEWTCPKALTGRVTPAIEHYFATDMDFDQLADELPWRTDAVLQRCRHDWPGLRLLRQPLGETLLAFLCSSAKQIPHIAQICEKMAARFGEPIGDGIQALPTWARLAEISEPDLRGCGLGYRARFIKQTALRLQAEPGWEDFVRKNAYAETHAWLNSLPGVGPKIADCVLLFGAANYEAFPVDTWILQAMAERYGLRGWRPAQVAQFGRAHFGRLAGLAQQFLFSGERSGKKKP